MPSTPLLLRELRPTLALAVPIVLGQVGQMAMGITDSVMIGRVGKVPLAAAAFANGVYGFVFIAGLGLLLPIAVLTARAHGARQPRECGEFLRHGVLLAATLGLAAFALLGVAGTQLHRFGQPAEVVAVVTPYFLLLSASLLPTFLFQVLKQSSEALGHPWAPMRILLGGVLLNAVLNWVLIYGHFGFPALGLTGAGIATLLARLLVLAVLWVWLARRPDVRAEWPERWGGAPEPARLREMFRLGVPASAQLLFEGGAFSAVALMMGWLGTVPLAAHQIAISCASFTFMVPLGLSSAAGMRLSQAAGAGRREALRPIGFGAFGAGLGLMVVFGLGFALGGRFLALGFTPEPEVVALATRLLIVAAIFQIFDGAQVIGAGALRGLTDVKIPTGITFVAYWLVSLPLGRWLAFHTALGAVGLWAGLAAGLGLAAVLLAWRFHRLTGSAAHERA